MRRTRVRRRRVGAGLISLGLAAAVGLPNLGGTGATAVASRTYVVRPGDTLWSIASSAAGRDDPRPLVDALERANGISAGELVPGRVIVIPSGVDAQHVGE